MRGEGTNVWLSLWEIWGIEVQEMGLYVLCYGVESQEIFDAYRKFQTPQARTYISGYEPRFPARSSIIDHPSPEHIY